LEDYDMHRTHRYIASLFLTAALVAPVSTMAVPVPQEARDQNRVYDKDHKDYHNWDDNENRAWGSSLRKTTRVRTNSRRRTRRSSRNTGIGAMLIQTKTSKVTTSAVGKSPWLSRNQRGR
jgi:hypothetical protein